MGKKQTRNFGQGRTSEFQSKWNEKQSHDTTSGYMELGSTHNNNTPENKDAPEQKETPNLLHHPTVPSPSIYVLSKSTHSLNMTVQLQSTTSLHTTSTSILLNSGTVGVFVNCPFIQKNRLETCPLLHPVPAHNVGSTPNKNRPIMEEAEVIL